MTHTIQTIPKRTRYKLAFILSMLAAMAPLCTDVYLPAFPQIADGLHAEASAVQMSLASSFLGMALGQILFGPLSDLKGRKVPLAVSLVLFVLSSFLCAASETVEWLIAMRFVQGLCGSGGVVLSRAVAADLYHGHELMKFFSLLMLINGVVPILGPIIGGQLLLFTDWHGIFVVLALAGLAMLLSVIFGLPETLPPSARHAGGLHRVKEMFAQLWQNRVFMYYTAMQAAIMAAFFGYIAASPFVFQAMYGLTASEYSMTFGINAFGIMLFAQAAGRLSARFGNRRLLKWGLLLALLASLTVLLASFGILAAHAWMFVGIFFVVASGGITMTTSFALAIGSQKGATGSASGLLGVAAFVAGSLSSPLVGIAGSHTAVPMGIVMAVCTALAGFCYKKTNE